MNPNSLARFWPPVFKGVFRMPPLSRSVIASCFWSRLRAFLSIALGGLPYEELMIDRSSFFEFAPGCQLQTCSAEDLIVLKLFAFRTRDVLDVETVVVRQRGALDWEYIEQQLAPLAEVKEQPQIMETLANFRKLR
jgi:hypothetical protein